MFFAGQDSCLNINFIPPCGDAGGFIVKIAALLCQHPDVTSWTMFTELFHCFALGLNVKAISASFLPLTRVWSSKWQLPLKHC